jgi:hypothetical protein
MPDSALAVSLETHLLDRLRAVRSTLPRELGEQVAEYTTSHVGASSPVETRSIPHALLHNVSRWARSAEGTRELEARGLDVKDYSMIALLAGTKTSPEKHFPTPVGGWPTIAQMRAQERKREITERQAIANVINALVSIGGCAAAVWYAAGVAGWQNEWVSKDSPCLVLLETLICSQRVLLAMLAAFVVAVAEAALYIIWTSYSTPSSRDRKRGLQPEKDDLSTESALLEGEDVSASGGSTTSALRNVAGLRQRATEQPDAQ